MGVSIGRFASSKFGLLIGTLALLLFGGLFFDWEETARHLVSASRPHLAAAVSCFLVGIVLRAAKWGYILNSWEHLEWSPCFHSVMMSNFANYFSPVRAGELLRLYVVNRIARVSYASSMATTLVDRSSSLVIITLVFTWFSLSGLQLGSTGHAGWLILVAAVAIGFLFAGGILADSLKRILEPTLLKLGISSAGTDRVIESRVVSFALRTLRKCNLLVLPTPVILSVFALSFGTLSLDAMANYWLLGAFGLELSPIQAFTSAALMNVAFVLPSPPGQVGNAELIPLAIYSYGFGLPPGEVSSAALIWHIVTMAITAVFGAYSSYKIGVRIGDGRVRKNSIGCEIL